MALSDRQKRILSFINQFAAERGYPPTIREIGAAVGIPSTSVVNYNLNVLQREGCLTRSPDVSRGISVVETEHDGSRLLAIPILGTIAAGTPIPTPTSDFSPFDYETLTLTADLVKPQEGLYALLVKGLSMIDALIDDGDFVVMKHQQEARNGEMVAVRLKAEDTTTLKYFFYEGGRVRLQPANPTMQPIDTDPTNVEVQGKVMAVFRQIK
jgi:repressor LexA